MGTAKFDCPWCHTPQSCTILQFCSFLIKFVTLNRVCDWLIAHLIFNHSKAALFKWSTCKRKQISNVFTSNSWPTRIFYNWIFLCESLSLNKKVFSQVYGKITLTVRCCQWQSPVWVLCGTASSQVGLSC